MIIGWPRSAVLGLLRLVRVESKDTEPPRLLDQVWAKMRVAHYSIRQETETDYHIIAC